ncbi:hypothetical protein U8P73_31170 (plasmid) [Rhizobium beringeri]|uniref:hypothetical protein n=1 Tax=Rhizobium beringeri TaxID=3019934 RepID=UPI002DDDA6A6|nr:hypothetical protein [Rhizobium beringeri]WSG92836.1 hypothetical protein U8P73_31170 [Rhizobium beringeri]
MSGPGGGPGGDNGNEGWRPASSIGTTGGKQSQGGSGGGGPNPCVFTEVTILASPNSAVIAVLVVGTILVVALSGPRVVAMHGSNIAGSITSARLADIIQCINAGQQYEARVTTISGGAVTVEVYPV